MRRSRSKLTLLIRTRLLALRNEWWRQGPRKRIQLLIFVAVWAWVIIWFTRVMATVFTTLRDLHVYAATLERLPGSVFLGFLVMLVVSGATVALGAFFLSGELEYLLTTPIPRTTVFKFRLIETAFLNATYLLVFGVPTAIALGLVFSASSIYYVLALVVLVAFLVLSTDLGVLAMLGLVRILPPKRAREILSAFLGLLFLGIWFGSDAIRARFFDPGSPHFDAARLDSVGHVVHYFSAPYLPSTWVGHALSEAARGNLLSAALPLAGLIGVAYVVHLFTARLADSIWARGTAAVVRRHQPGAAEPEAITWGQKRPSRALALFSREWRMFSRETQQLMRILILGGMAVLFPLLGTGRNTGTWWTPFLLPTLLGGMAACTLGTILVPLERRGFWFIKVAPGGIRKTVVAKAGVAWMVGAAVLLVSNIVVLLRQPVTASVFALVLLGHVFLAGALASVGLGVGAFFARFDWEHPKRVLRAPGSLVYMLGSLAVVGVALGLPGLATVLLGESKPATLAGIYTVTSAVLAAAGFAVAVGLAVGRLEKLEWTF